MSALYKVLHEDGTPCHGGRGQWHLPKNGRPGRWMPRRPHPILCARGYHLCRPGDLLEWLGPALWTAEADGVIVEAADKIVVERARLLARVDTYHDRMLRLFACDCAERALDRRQITDAAAREAVAVARAYAYGEATDEQLAAAQAAAARDPAWDAAWAAARHAARDPAGDAAWAAARDPAGDAAWDAAWAAAWNAERAWQVERLLQYLRGEVPS